MTFESSAFPRTLLPTCLRCGSPECSHAIWEWTRIGRLPRDFPALRADPPWQPTWIRIEMPATLRRYDDMDERGHWFPPLVCQVIGRPYLGRLAPYVYQSHECLNRLYSSPLCRCADCLAAATAIDVMLNGCAWALAQWPEQWEHRCYWRNQWIEDPTMADACTCGATISLTNAAEWLDWKVWLWSADNRQTTTTTLNDILRAFCERIAEDAQYTTPIIFGQ